MPSQLVCRIKGEAHLETHLSCQDKENVFSDLQIHTYHVDVYVYMHIVPTFQHAIHASVFTVVRP